MKIGITGSKGRIGQLLVGELKSGIHEGAEFAGGIDKNDDAETLFKNADAIIDFTTSSASAAHAKLAAKHKTILVLATSGLSTQDEKTVEDAAKDTVIVYASNTSVGVNVMMGLVEQAAARLDGANWDAEIIDVHHRNKIDAPSGTSYALAKSIQKGRDENAPLTHERHGETGAREQGSIGFSVQRGGDSTIENTAIFFGNGERLEITHRAMDRAIFAKGAIRAALWAADRKPGLYSMRDVLDL